mgnify:CR=1 FL=1
MITAICDLSPRLERRRELVVLVVVVVCFLGGIPTTTYVRIIRVLPLLSFFIYFTELSSYYKSDHQCECVYIFLY